MLKTSVIAQNDYKRVIKTIMNAKNMQIHECLHAH